VSVFLANGLRAEYFAVDGEVCQMLGVLAIKTMLLMILTDLKSGL
jgi:hypothetical protein